MQEITAANPDALDWGDREVTVTLTNDQWRLLHVYLLLTQGYREREIKKWEELTGFSGDGLAAKNAKFWKGLAANAEAIQKVITDLRR